MPANEIATLLKLSGACPDQPLEKKWYSYPIHAAWSATEEKPGCRYNKKQCKRKAMNRRKKAFQL